MAESSAALPPASARRGVAMRHTEELSAYPHEIAHPQCNNCGVPMWLARIEPYLGKPNHDKRTFECPACAAVIAEIVKYR